MSDVRMSDAWSGDNSPFGETPAKPPRGTPWDRLETSLLRASEWLNPILVKEARQALKSRQFIITFTLLLLFGWGWSVLGVALLSPGVYFAPGGRTMLTGYCFILIVPMLLIVPFSAFRSLAAEREDGTFELLSISALTARQIVTGKLGSAILQMLVYYSALAPCIAFTYLLRGIDILTILLILFYTFLASILLSALGLLNATITRSRQWQSLLAVSQIAAFGAANVFASYAVAMTIWATGSIEFDNFYFWITQLAILTFYASFLVLFVTGAAARISFASDNRSTKIRIVLFLQQVLWIFWMSYLWIVTTESDVLYGIMPFAAFHWYVAGAIMSGETGGLSPRVQRTLPQSFLGRALFTWFNPGSGTGYMFVVLNVWALAIFVTAAAISAELTGQMGGNSFGRIITLTTLAAAYVTAYLGAGRLIVLVVRQFVPVGLVLPLLLQIIMAAFGAFVPVVLGGWLQGFDDMDYTPLQMTNWAWTLVEAGDGDLWVWEIVPLSIYAVAAMMLFVNLGLAFREVEQVRLQTPQRVVEDDIELHPERASSPRPAGNPWRAAPATEASDRAGHA